MENQSQETNRALDQNSAGATTASDPLQRKVTFNFRKTTPKALAEQLAANLEDIYKPEFLNQFDTLDGDEKATTDVNAIKYLKRKSVSHTIQLPEFIAQLPEEDQKYVADIVENTISTYVKQNYIDAFEEVGPHDWEVIKKWIDSKGSRGAKWDFDKETLENAAKAFGQYIAQVTGNAPVGDRLEATAKARFTRASIQRHVNDFSPEVIGKIKTKLEEFMGWLGENDEDLFEEYAPVYSCWEDALNRHLAKDTEDLDIASVL